MQACKVFLALMLIFGPACASAAVPEEFKFTAPIELAETSDRAASVLLPLPVFARVLSAADMRIYDNQNRETPFILHEWNRETINQQRYPEIFNSGVKGGTQTLQFMLPDDIDEINSIDLEIQDEAYNTTVDVASIGKLDSDFKVVKQDLRIVRLSSEGTGLRYEFNHLEFPAQRERKYLLTIQLGPDQKPLTIMRVGVNQTSTQPEIRVPAPMRVRTVGSENFKPLKQHFQYRAQERTKSAFYLLEPDEPGAPIDRLKFAVGEGEFVRRAAVYTLDAGEQRLGPNVASGTIFRLRDQQNLVLDITPTRAAKYLLEIYNGDDLPLALQNATGDCVAVEARFFAAAKQAPYKLYFASAAPTVPAYDIAERIARLGKLEFLSAKLGAVAPNPGFKEPVKRVPKSEQFPMLLYIAVGALVLLLAWRLVGLAGKASK